MLYGLGIQNMKSGNNSLNRRRFLGTAAASASGLAAATTESLAASAAATGSPNLISRENEKPGTRDWQLARVRINRGQYRTSLIEGYCSHQSISAGQTLSIYVSTEPAREFTIDIYRMGYYGGHGARLVQTLGPIAGQPQAVPEPGTNRVRECRWQPSVDLAIPANWPSGVYLGKLTTIPAGDEPYWQSYVIFIVRDERRADVLFQCSDNTWQAYNRWPQSDSLYTHPDGAHVPGVAVSFDRPYGKYCQIFDHPLSVGSGEFLLWEYPLCYWLEQQGCDVTYAGNCDLLDVDFATRCKSYISIGHDEYWDVGQYRTIESAIEKGVSVLWLSGNSVYMVSPFSQSSTGEKNRVITRTGSYGPLRSEEVEAYGTFMGPFDNHGPDERNIIGARTVVPFNGGSDWTCTSPEHWVFAGTGMKRGDSIPGLVGWEYHGDPDKDRAGLEVLAEGTVWAGGTIPGHWTSTIFPGPQGNFVFNASTIFWAQGLASPPGHILPWSHGSRPLGPDARVQRITQNLLARAMT